MTKDSKSKFWNFVDNFEGDKVVWMIVLMLILISIIAIFSSTSLLAIEQQTTKGAIIAEQLFFSLIGLGVIILIYNIKNISILKWISKYCFLICFLMLSFLALHLQVGPIKARSVNDAWRVITIFGIQLHVFEATKVAMVLYLAWAIDAIKSDTVDLYQKFGNLPFFKNMTKETQKKVFYIYSPICIVTLLILTGSVSSALFIGLIMALTILIGGVSVKDVVGPGILITVIAGGIAFGAYKVSDGKVFNRLGTAASRLEAVDYMDTLRAYKGDKSSQKFQKAADKIRQPVSAKIAVKEGGLLGKGPGGSTQRYVVSVMFGDYMYSFIIEEYGLLGGIVVCLLYLSLLARGSMIVRNCKSTYAKAAVAGLTLLITGQAFMHMLINVDLGPLTGQTLPLVSHGASSFLMFCIAFGVILSISKMAKRQMDNEARTIIREEGELIMSGHIVEDEDEPGLPTDEISATIQDVEDIEDQFNDRIED